MISVSLSFNNLLIFHRESQGLMFFRAIPNQDFDMLFLERIRYALSRGDIQFPQKWEQIVIGMFEQKYLILSSSKLTQIILICDNKPNQFASDALKAFTIRFESRWRSEILQLYDLFRGNIDLFHRSSNIRQSVTLLVDEIFYISFTNPHKLGIPRIKLQGNYKKIWEMAEFLAKDSGYLMIKSLWLSCSENLAIDKDLISDIIYEFLARGYIYIKSNSP